MGIAVIDLATEKVTVVLRHPSKDFQDGLVRWSPDGERLAFYRWRDDEAAVWVVDVDGTNLEQLTPAALLCGDPDWAPDGGQLICASRPPGRARRC